ncbi:uncharacterized protein MONOS_17482 [Monocercomonoides exilis]|uniref:uncharacterized protein n=1 Tax=Monocercomonoides exilis TaxID=2049356 RepID=UPI00355AB4A9|nr:hypothetical protein MONOS_17482 [Monocercomonoides exilis]
MEEEKSFFKDDTNSLNFVVISDLHNNKEMFDKFMEWCKVHQEILDVCIMLGDMENYFHNRKMETRDVEEMEKRVIDRCKQISLLFKLILFIPGNHEPPMFYHASSLQISDNVFILHGSIKKICEGLIAAGVGGCIPGVSRKQKIFKGYPFNTEVDFFNFLQSSQIEKLAQYYQSSSTSSISESQLIDDAVIFLTHDGPVHSLTTFSMNEDHIDSLGSVALSKFLLHSSHSSLLNHIEILLHGHTHESVGFFGEHIVAQEIAEIEQVQYFDQKFGEYSTNIDEEGVPTEKPFLPFTANCCSLTLGYFTTFFMKKIEKRWIVEEFSEHFL